MVSASYTNTASVKEEPKVFEIEIPTETVVEMPVRMASTVSIEKEDLSEYFDGLSIYPIDINELLSPIAKDALADYVDTNCKYTKSANVKLIEFLGTDLTESENEICLHFVFGKDQYRCIYLNTESGEIYELYNCVLTKSMLLHWGEI